MHNKINKIIFIVIIILSIGLLFIYLNNKNKIKEYSINLNYMDKYIDIKIYSNNYDKANIALKNLDKIFNKYHVLTDNKNLYNNKSNLYFINNNNLDIDNIMIDKELYSLIKKGKEYFNLSNGIFNISKNNDINSIILLEDNRIINNKPNIDLNYINIGFALNEAKQYLYDNGFDRFIIDASSNKVLGFNYDKSNYNVGIEDAINHNIIDIISLNNKSISTISRQDKIIDIKTNKEIDYFKSVTVISSDEILNSFLSYVLYLMPINEGKEFIKNYDVEVIWIDNNSNIETTDNYIKYKVI